MNTCKRCNKADVKMFKCGRCKTAQYCSKECQKRDWKTHKTGCRAPARKVDEAALFGNPEEDKKIENDAKLKKLAAEVARKDDDSGPEEESDGDEMGEDGMRTLSDRQLKTQFDKVVKKYNFQEDATASKLADFLSSAQLHGTKVSHIEFAEKFGMDPAEAITFLSWIQVGIKFKNETNQNKDNFAQGKAKELLPGVLKQ